MKKFAGMGKGQMAAVALIALGVSSLVVYSSNNSVPVLGRGPQRALG